MKKHRVLLIFAAVLILCAGGAWGFFQATARYPQLGEAVSYPVNQAEGLTLFVRPSWSPLRGYTVDYEIEVNLEAAEVYTLEGEFEHLERLVDGQWRRLKEEREDSLVQNTFALDGKTTGFTGSVVQKYQGYGTRLESGTYRLTLEMKSPQEETQYLAAEFTAA